MASRALPASLTIRSSTKVRRIMRVALDGGTQSKAALRAGLSRSAMIKFLDDLAGIGAWPPHLPTLYELSLLPVRADPPKRKARYLTAGRRARDGLVPQIKAEIDGVYRAGIVAAADAPSSATAGAA